MSLYEAGPHTNRKSKMGKEFNLKTGKLGEEIAGDFLEKKGYKIIERNYRTKYGEIDLVCLAPLGLIGAWRRKKELVVVEVRTKIGEDFGTPEESLTKKKIKKVWLNALAYVGKNDWKDNYRADAVCIVLRPGGGVERLEHYENIT